jgi:hypothetical protein
MISIAVLALLLTATGAFARTNNADNVTSDSSGVDSGIGDANISYGVVQGTANTWSGFYNPAPPADGNWGALPTGWFDNTTTGPQDIDVMCDVVLWASTTMDANQAYFNVAGNVGPLSAQFTGTLSSNGGMYTGIAPPTRAPLCNIHKLVRTEDYRGGALTADAQQIPVAWTLAEALSGTWTAFRNPDATDTDGADSTIHHADWWLLNGGANGFHQFALRATITPAAYQKAGRYMLDPTLVATPEM